MKARRPTWFRINADPISDPDDLDPEDDSDSRALNSAEKVGERASSVGVTGELNNKELDKFQKQSRFIAPRSIWSFVLPARKPASRRSMDKYTHQ